MEIKSKFFRMNANERKGDRDYNNGAFELDPPLARTVDDIPIKTFTSPYLKPEDVKSFQFMQR
jgi:hypothetical protein